MNGKGDRQRPRSVSDAELTASWNRTFGTPNPGSDTALELGCTCPVLDNGRGRRGPPFWITEGCPLHGGKENVDG